MQKALRSILVPVALMASAGCGSKPTTPTPAAPRAAVTAPLAPRIIPRPVALAVEPAAATLAPWDAGLQLLAAQGRADRTGVVAWSAAPAGVVEVGPGGYVRPIGPGKAVVRAVGAQGAATADVTVAAAAERPWDFGADVVPIFTRHGCNLGGCHGRAEGQASFHLSFLGYDPESDHRALTREAGGRRLAAFDPAQSLVLLKGSGQVAHGGGSRLPAGSADFRTIADWVAAGAPMQRGKTHGALVGVAVEPADPRLDAPGPRQFRVVARYADGRTRDVTRLATYKVGDDTAAEVDADGRVTLRRRAEVDLIVRYGPQVVAARISTVINPELEFDYAKLPRRNFIDDALYRRLEALKVPPSGPATDAAFLRRATLDLTGQVPDPQQVRDFLKDADPEKRVKRVDRLLAAPEFEGFWRVKLGDLLQISNARFGGGAGRYQDWLKDRLRKHVPWDAMVRELLTTLGDPDSADAAAANYALDGVDPKEKAEQTAQRFLGLRLRCAQCHDHPFDVWTQDDYFGLAAFFAQTGPGTPGPAAAMMDRIVKVNPAGQVLHPRTGKPAVPRLPDGAAVAIAAGEDPRKALAAWMTGPANPYFARASANWVWAQMFGRGLADPADDLARANPPVHPELLDALARHFVESKYDLRALIRAVAISNAYGASSSTVPGNERDDLLFSHQRPRPLTAHQMADALATVTDVPNRYGALGHRLAIEVNDPSTPSAILDTFGRCPRVVGCGSVATPSLSLRQALLVIGGDVVDGKVAHLKGYLHGLMELEPAADEVVVNLYLRALARYPTDREVRHWTPLLGTGPALAEAAEDLFWSLLNSREFAFNH